MGGGLSKYDPVRTIIRFISHKHACTHTHTRTHARTYARTHSLTHSLTHTLTHTQTTTTTTTTTTKQLDINKIDISMHINVSLTETASLRCTDRKSHQNAPKDRESVYHSHKQRNTWQTGGRRVPLIAKLELGGGAQRSNSEVWMRKKEVEANLLCLRPRSLSTLDDGGRSVWPVLKSVVFVARAFSFLRRMFRKLQIN